MRPSLLHESTMQLVRVLTMQADDKAQETLRDDVDGVEVRSVSPSVGPVQITVTFWLDREPDVDYKPLPQWLAAATLYRASELVEEDDYEDLMEADVDEPDEGQEEEV